MRCVVIIQRKRDGSSMVQAKRQMVLEDWDKGRVDELGDEAGSWEVFVLFYRFVFFFVQVLFVFFISCHSFCFLFSSAFQFFFRLLILLRL